MKKTNKIKTIKAQETTSSKIFWALMYMVLILVVLVSSCFIFHKTYYVTFFVSGPSMEPTLNNRLETGEYYVPGSYMEYGKADDHQIAIQRLSRFQVAITYYPEDVTGDVKAEKPLIKSTADTKIKRVIGLPGEKITITKEADNTNKIYINDSDSALELPFEPRNKSGLNEAFNSRGITGNSFDITLADDEYFMMGDNWGISKDSSDPKVGPIDIDLIVGVVISVDGYCKVNEKDEIIEKNPYETSRLF